MFYLCSNPTRRHKQKTGNKKGFYEIQNSKRPEDKNKLVTKFDLFSGARSIVNVVLSFNEAYYSTVLGYKSSPSCIQDSVWKHSNSKRYEAECKLCPIHFISLALNALRK